MCGIAGFLSSRGADEPALRNQIGAIRHRGPDDVGLWTDADAGVGLAQARLAIIDLSAAGHQPMHSASDRYVLTFNGEVYNHVALRSELEQCDGRRRWRGHSDTETLLAGMEQFGPAGAIAKAVGMFAFALWDRRDRTLTLGRDRVGEKPLYYGWFGDTFLFGSELKALKTHPSFRATVDRGALALYMRHNYIPAPYTIYSGVQKLVPGTMLTISLRDRDAAPRPYWELRQVVADGLSNRFQGSPQDAVTVLEEKLRLAVKQQMMADVPLGAFLSGGVDSSTIVALMQAQSSIPVRTFTIGFHESGFDEAVHAKAVAKHLGTDHTELYVSPEEALSVIPRLPSMYSEPFADSSQIPTFLVSQMTRRHVTVSLSGDAGDELFAGYNRYVLGQRLWGTVSRFPASVRSALAGMIRRVPARHWNSLLGPIQRLLPAGIAQANVGDKIVKAAGVLGARSEAELYRLLVSHWTDVESLVKGATEPPTLLNSPNAMQLTGNFVHDMMFLDQLTYLPDDILAKVDRAAMAVSLETRVPFLDHRVIDFAWRLPLDYKLRGGVSKWPVREILYKHVPKQLIERPKMGFGIPLAAWLRGPLRDWAEELLGESRIRDEGYLNPEPIRRKWAEHLSGARNWQHQLWNVLMWQAWLAEQR